MQKLPIHIYPRPTKATYYVMESVHDELEVELCELHVHMRTFMYISHTPLLVAFLQEEKR